MTKRVELFTPLYYLSLSIVVFTGFVVLSVYHFQIKAIVYLMMASVLVMIYSAFKTHKKFKRTRVKDIESQITYRNFAANKYKVDIAILIFVIILSFAVATWFFYGYFDIITIPLPYIAAGSFFEGLLRFYLPLRVAGNTKKGIL